MTTGGSDKYAKEALRLQQEQYEEMKRAEEEAYTEEEQKRIEEARRKAKGRGSTILTSGLGVLEQAPVSRKTLLGQ